MSRNQLFTGVLWRTVENKKPGPADADPGLKTRSSAGYRQRVVIRNPMNAMPKPTRMFHAPSAGMGYWFWLT